MSSWIDQLSRLVARGPEFDRMNRVIREQACAQSALRVAQEVHPAPGQVGSLIQAVGQPRIQIVEGTREARLYHALGSSLGEQRAEVLELLIRENMILERLILAPAPTRKPQELDTRCLQATYDLGTIGHEP